MAWTGLIFGAIGLVWLIFVPMLLQRRNLPEVFDGEVIEPFSATVTIVRRGTDLAMAEPGSAEVSTPLTRRAQLRELALADARAAARRRRILGVLFVGVLLTAGGTILRVLPWWANLISGGLVVAFLVLARVSVRAMRAELDAQAEAIASTRDEETIAIREVEIIQVDRTLDSTPSVELDPPTTHPGSLWDPIPITKATYVSQPLAPRTVRTIDLAGPVPPPRRGLPVVAEAPESASEVALPDVPRPRVAGE